MSNASKKAWYSHGWGILIAIIFFPFFAIWYIWEKTKWNENTKIAVTGIIALFTLIIGIGGIISAEEKEEEIEDSSPSEADIQQVVETKEPEKIYYDVARVVDGDTIEVNIDGTNEKVRLIGIDTPETVDPQKDVECFGTEASNKAKELLEGKKVYLESDDSQSDRDKYDRLLRYVFLEDGTHINKVLIEQGYAQEYTYDVPYKYQEEFKKAQEEAKTAKLGLWPDDACNKPEEETTETTENITNTGSTSTSTTTTPVTPAPKPTTTTYNCDCSKTCPQMSSCAEAQYQLNVCGCQKRDNDNDGIACDAAPLNCQK